MAFRVLNLEQGSDEWLEARRGYVTGTDLAVLDGCSPFVSTKDELLKIKRGEKTTYVSEAMLQGSQYEELAMRYLNEKVGEVFEPVVVVDDNQCILVSLDGADLLFTKHAEIKIPLKGRDSELWKSVSKGVVPRYYLLQIMGGLQVTEAIECYFWVFDLETRTGLLVIVQRDEDLIALNKKNAKEFYEKYLTTGKSPGDSLPVIPVSEPEFDEIGIQILALKSVIKEATAQVSQLESVHQEMVGPEKAIYRGDIVQLTKSVTSPRVDYSALIEDLTLANPEFNLEKYRPEPNPQDSSYRISTITL